MTVDLTALHIDGVVLDIEGTTTPVAFVYETLFPYARAHVAGYLARHHDSPGCREAVALLRDERAGDLARGEISAVAQPPSPVPGFGEPRRSESGGGDFSPAVIDFSPSAIVAYIHWLMDRDRKSRGLKMLQGLIWEEGYRTGELRGQVYADVGPALERWRARGVRIYIYSSGSVLAQQLLFQSTNAGDLTRLLDGYFDTAVGPKRSPESYRLIVERIGMPAPQTLFVSDVVGELDAAREAGLQTVLCVRSSGPAAPTSHPVIRSFDELVG